MKNEESACVVWCAVANSSFFILNSSFRIAIALSIFAIPYVHAAMPPGEPLWWSFAFVAFKEALLGALIAVLLWWMPKLNRVLDPYLVVLNALPKIALGPVLIVWIGAGMASIVVMGVLVSLVVTTVTVLNGFLAATDEKQLLMRTLGATKLQIFTKVVLPAGVPDLISALKISVGMSWVGVIVGEYLVSKAGLGYLIVYGGQVFKLDLVMASVTVLCVLAALMYYAVAFLEKKVRT